jgi:hypothetical protein
MEDLPALPLTLQELKCELPMHDDPMYNVRPIVLKGLYPDWVGWIDHVLRQSMIEMNQQSKERCAERCSLYKEEIMMTVWHPRRVAPLIEMGIDLESVM